MDGSNIDPSMITDMCPRLSLARAEQELIDAGNLHQHLGEVGKVTWIENLRVACFYWRCGVIYVNVEINGTCQVHWPRWLCERRSL